MGVRTIRRGVRVAIGAALGGSALVAAGIPIASALAPVPGVRPDLVPNLPLNINPGQRAPVFVDAVQRPGHILYRFDSVIGNRGGALDIQRDPNTGHVIQSFWPAGVPTVAPDPNQFTQGATAEDRTAEAGARMFYWSRKGHEHWHLGGVALYEIVRPGGKVVVASKSKVGFCISDTYGGAGRPSSYPFGFTGPSTLPHTWCQPFQPRATFVREGLSPGYGDYYWSQLWDQWIDVTDLPPGRYTLRAVANPDGVIDEADRSNNTLDVRRLIPGVVATSEGLGVGGVTGVPLHGRIVAPQIPGRRPTCKNPAPTTPFAKCYVTASAKGPLVFRVRREPSHGKVAIVRRARLGALAVYRPAPGFRGRDRFTYTATDVRGLRSRPAVVSLRVR
jgi:hypothetical protein